MKKHHNSIGKTKDFLENIDEMLDSVLEIFVETEKIIENEKVNEEIELVNNKINLVYDNDRWEVFFNKIKEQSLIISDIKNEIENSNFTFNDEMEPHDDGKQNYLLSDYSSNSLRLFDQTYKNKKMTSFCNNRERGFGRAKTDETNSTTNNRRSDSDSAKVLFRNDKMVMAQSDNSFAVSSSSRRAKDEVKKKRNYNENIERYYLRETDEYQALKIVANLDKDKLAKKYETYSKKIAFKK